MLVYLHVSGAHFIAVCDRREHVQSWLGARNEQGWRGHGGISAGGYRRRARYTPSRMTSPPTILFHPSDSPKKTIPDATPTVVMRYW